MCHRKMGKEQEHTVEGMGNGMWVAVKGKFIIKKAPIGG